MLKTRDGKINLSSKRVRCGSKRSGFMKKEKANRLLSDLGITKPLDKCPLLRKLLFSFSYICWL